MSEPFDKLKAQAALEILRRATEHLEREREADRAAIREAHNLMDPNSSWHRTHALAIQRATEARG